MTVAVVTDSTSDIPSDVADQLGITIVPLYVQFGKESYHDSVDLTGAEFYHKLMHDADYPKTSAPNLADFLSAYDDIAKRTRDILGVHLGAKISATYNMAVSAAKQADVNYHIELIDTKTTMMAAGLLTIEAAKLAKTGVGLEELSHTVRDMLPKAHVLCLVDNAKYLGRGGHTSENFKEHFGSASSEVPLIEIKDEIKPFGKAETRTKAIDALYRYANSFSPCTALAVEYATDAEEAKAMAAHLEQMFPGVPIYMSVIGAVVGAHFGPGALAVSILEE